MSRYSPLNPRPETEQDEKKMHEFMWLSRIMFLIATLTAAFTYFMPRSDDYTVQVAWASIVLVTGLIYRAMAVFLMWKIDEAETQIETDND